MFKRLALVVALAATQGRVPATFRYAYGAPDCAPWDGPAFRIVIQSQPVAPHEPDQLPKARFPQYSVSLWKDKPVGRWIPIQMNQMGTIISCPAQGQCKAMTGRVRLDSLTESRVTGELRVDMGDHSGRELVFPFDAPIIHARMFCG